MKRTQRRAHARGALTVEMAICLPLLFTIFFGAVELSRTNMIRLSADNAAYEGARRGIVPGATAADAIARANSVMSLVGVSNATITTTPAVITSTTSEVTVQIDVPMDSNGYITPMFMSGKTMTAKFTLQREVYEQTAVP